jgi:outer membrane protein assembly factor BamB
MSGRSSSVGARGVGMKSCLGNVDWRGLVPAAALFFIAGAVFFLNTAETSAQVAVQVDPANAAVQRGFSITFDDRLSDSLAKFDEFVKAKAWERAFHILADVPENKWLSMMPDREGFIRSASNRVRETLLQLPADGREAYRIYFDAKARRLFESIATARKDDDVAIARTIYDRYFITSVGDDAADWLADDCFERGQFADAARLWKSIFEFHPDSNLAEPKILVKRAIALFRSGSLSEFRSVREQLTQEFPGTRVVLGGQEIVADEYLKRLETAEPAKPAEPKKIASEPVFRGLAPADGAQPAWQFRFLDEKDVAAIEDSVRNWYGAASMTAILPAAATDGERFYGNWLGSCFAIDLASGKTLWSTEPNVKGVVSRLRGRMMQVSMNLGQFALSLGQIGEGTRVVVAVSAVTNEQNRFHLVAFDALTGHPLWTSDRSGSDLIKASFVCAPLIDGNSIFALSHEVSNENEQPANAMVRMGRSNGVSASALTLRRLDLRSGTEIWSIPLGTPQMVGNGWGQQFMPIPALVRSGDHLYVLTNDGALLSVSVNHRQIDWGFKYPPPNYGQNRQQFFNPAGMPGRPLRTTGPIVVRDGVIYFKESMGATLYALEENGPRLRWKWEDSELTNLVGLDEGDLYLFYGELSAISRTKPETRWSNRLTVELPGVGAQVGSQAILVFTPRGLFELSKETGDVRRIFRGADLGAAGGFVLSAGKRLVCVSNLAVTAYPEPSTN